MTERAKFAIKYLKNDFFPVENVQKLSFLLSLDF